MHTILNSTKTLICLPLIAMIISGCSFIIKQPPIQKDVSLYHLPFFKYPEFSDDMGFDSLEHAISQSLSYLNRLPAERKFKFENDAFEAAHMIKSLEVFLNFIKTKPDHQQLNEFIKSNYIIYKSVGSKQTRQVLFTGYYEPLLQGSLQKSETYRFPIYAQPSDLSVIDLSPFSPKLKGKKIVGRYTNPEFVPYFDRKEIESKGLPNDIAPVLAWVNNRVDLFFLQIQGSGKVYLNNGRIINVHYHSSNGHPYRSIGNYLITNDKIVAEEMSMQKIKEYLSQHPEEIDTILNYNPSYVFFKIEEDGPYGSLDVKLTPGRSIALDKRVFPAAGLTFIETKIPIIDGNGKIDRWSDISRFVLNQDTGGAIQGPDRADLFWGNGSYAEVAAGYMKHPGSLYFLVLKTDN